MARVLVFGLDPTQFDQWDPEPILTGIARGRAKFDEHGVEADWCLLDFRDDADATVEGALTSGDYECVVIGGGIRRNEDSLEFFEKLINLVRRHQPAAAIAFNASPDSCLEAAQRWLP